MSKDTPWKLCEGWEGDPSGFFISNANGVVIISSDELTDIEIAAHIVKCVNEKDILIKALEEISRHQEYEQIYGGGLIFSHCALIAQNVLAKAKGDA